MKEFDELIEIMAKLRAPGGCPWDREQTLETLKPYLLEEAYETIEAMGIGGEELKGELGDLLLQVVFQAQIMSEKGEFSIEDVVKKLNDKLVRRHPHVFADIKANTSGEVIVNWDRIKAEEKEHQNRKSVLDGIPAHLPPLAKAMKLQGKAAKVGFDWENIDGAIDKMEEELEEFRDAFKSGDKKQLKEEIGDLIFSLVNVARLADIDIVDSLINTNKKFDTRFRYIEKRCNVKEASLDEMDKLWNEAKTKERNVHKQ